MLLLFTVKIIPPPCAQGLDFMLKACVFCDENSDTCRKFTNNYRNFDTFRRNICKVQENSLTFARQKGNSQKVMKHASSSDNMPLSLNNMPFSANKGMLLACKWL